MRYVASVALVVVLCPALVASAQDRPSAALLATSGAGGFDAAALAGIDRVLRSELTAIDRVRVHGSVALALEDIQIALGCEGETQACLGAVAREIGVRFLLLPNLDRIGSETVLSVALFDADADGAPRRLARRASGEGATGALVEEVHGLLVELLGDDAPSPVAAPIVEPIAAPIVEPPALPPPSRHDDGRLATAGVLIFVGVAGLGLGTGFGVSTLERRAAYERAPSDTVEQAEEAARRLVQAREDALTANVLLIGGAIAAGAGLAWLIAELASAGGEPDVSVAPLVGPELAGVEVAGSW